MAEHAAGVAIDAPAPTVICDDVHVVYKVLGHSSAPSAGNSLRRMVAVRGKGTVSRSVHAVRGVSLIAREGDAIALIGRNGSGKSTLLRAIAGLMPARKGHVYTAGRPSLLGVNAALMRDLTGDENILLGCMAMGMTREEALARREWILEFAGLGDFITLPMSAYSSGMGARLRFAIAASKSHEILMIDEALATGDAEFRRRSEQRILELREEAGTVFLVSHSLGVVRMTCNRAIWLEQGKVVMDGEANEVVDAYEAMYDPEGENQAKARRKARRKRKLGELSKEERGAARAARRARREAKTAKAAATGRPGEEDTAAPSPDLTPPDVPIPGPPETDRAAGAVGSIGQSAETEGRT